MLSKLLENPIVQSFPRAKQMRLAIEGFNLCMIGNLTLLRDAVTMSNQITAKGINIVERISTSDIKCIKDLHDRAVNLYNEIKYAPVPINPGYYQFLIDKGLEIGDSGCVFKIPQDTNIIRKWGNDQNHCIGSYADDCAKNTTLLMGVWDKNGGDWIGHLQLWPVHTAMGAKNPKGSPDDDVRFEIQVKQFYGKQNTPVADDIRDSVVCYLENALAEFIEARNKRLNPEAEVVVHDEVPVSLELNNNNAILVNN